MRLKPTFSIFLTSFLILFLEMTLIRWVPTQVRVVGYFPNLILISAFLGIGLGCLLSKKTFLQNLWIFFLAALVGLVIVLGKFIIYNENPSEFLWLLYNDLPHDAPTINGIGLPLLSVFLLTALCFVPLGHKLASNLNIFREEKAILKGYCWDISASLLGVILFSVISYFGIFPAYWFLLIGIFGYLLFYSEFSKILMGLLIILVAGIFLVVKNAERAQVYSPYYAISVKEVYDKFWMILVNGSSHQVFQSMRLDQKFDAPDDFNTNRMIFANGYHRPYRYFAKPPKNVLIIGAGNGNDVAVALQNGAENIDAVEIDPEIIKIGKTLHPDHPYSSDKVRIINTDARTFINNTDKKYDLVIFATLDSMTKLSALSNVRLDNFIYTDECIESVKRVLSEKGGLVMNFSIADPAIRIKLMAILSKNFDDVYKIDQDSLMFNVAYLAGNAFHDLNVAEPDLFKIKTAELQQNLDKFVLPNDNWPYLYLTGKSISLFYIKIILSILAFATIAIYACARWVGMTTKVILKPDWEMYLLGMGFLLFEGQACTTMSLIWGTTWITSAAVFSSILFMILVSTIFTNSFKVNWKLAFAGLFACLIITYYLPLAELLYLPTGLKLLISMLIIGLPFFFSGICFAHAFRVRTNADHAFGWNLFGAVCGGLVEFLSMITGFKVLILIALGIYLGSFLIKLKASKEIE